MELNGAFNGLKLAARGPRCGAAARCPQAKKDSVCGAARAEGLGKPLADQAADVQTDSRRQISTSSLKHQTGIPHVCCYRFAICDQLLVR